MVINCTSFFLFFFFFLRRMEFESGTGIRDVVVTDPVYKMFGMVVFSVCI